MHLHVLFVGIQRCYMMLLECNPLSEDHDSVWNAYSGNLPLPGFDARYGTKVLE